ncbi:MAG: PHP domain-containing protein [Armatimonadetes bacterium]|nr:PHP domain-containing protein [Armatimonadota bacterium]
MRDWRADFHLHTVLSPCGDLAMSPATIMARAAEIGLDLVAVSDHNSAKNTPAWRDAAAARGVKALYGLEVRSAEEVDVLTVFDEVEAALAFGQWVYAALPDIACDERVFGEQIVVDGQENILGFEPRLLISGIEHDLETVCATAREHGALVIGAHVDRGVDSILSQLGWLPEGLAIDAVEVTRYTDEQALVEAHPSLAGVPMVRFSDAHLPADIGFQQTLFRVEEPSVAELKLALAGLDGRSALPLRRALSDRS